MLLVILTLILKIDYEQQNLPCKFQKKVKNPRIKIKKMSKG